MGNLLIADLSSVLPPHMNVLFTRLLSVELSVTPSLWTFYLLDVWINSAPTAICLLDEPLFMISLSCLFVNNATFRLCTDVSEAQRQRNCTIISINEISKTRNDTKTVWEVFCQNELKLFRLPINTPKNDWEQNYY